MQDTSLLHDLIWYILTVNLFYILYCKRLDAFPQKTGKYPPPKGESEILGLEAAGEIVEIHPSCSSKLNIGSKVMALLAGLYWFLNLKSPQRSSLHSREWSQILQMSFYLLSRRGLCRVCQCQSQTCDANTQIHIHDRSRRSGRSLADSISAPVSYWCVHMVLISVLLVLMLARASQALKLVTESRNFSFFDSSVLQFVAISMVKNWFILSAMTQFPLTSSCSSDICRSTTSIRDWLWSCITTSWQSTSVLVFVSSPPLWTAWFTLSLAIPAALPATLSDWALLMANFSVSSLLGLVKLRYKSD